MATWQPEGVSEADVYWPRWLGEDRRDVGVWSLHYPAATTPWRGETMHLIDRSRNVLALMEADGFADAPDRPLIFIAHSFGGLVVKQLLETAEESPSRAWKTILSRTDGVVFIATPNSGSNLANFIDFVAKRLVQADLLTTTTAKELKHGEPNLLKLNRWYRNNAPNKHGIRTLAFCEKQNTVGVLVVDEVSADPNIQGAELIPLDRNHITICKPFDRDDILYKQVLRFVDGAFSQDIPPPLPDPSSENNGCNDAPTVEVVKQPPREEPELVVLAYENRTGQKVRIALYDWSRHYAKRRGRWRFLDSPPDGQERRHEDFTKDSTGWFSVYVVTADGQVSKCLGTQNLFAGRKPRIIIESDGGNFRARMPFDP